MMKPLIPANEAARLAALRAYDVLDSEREAAFDRITALASSVFDVPIALISLVDDARQWFKSAHGLVATETARDVSFCAHALHDGAPMIVADALRDARFADNPHVTGDPHVRFYAGAPLTTPSGARIGTLCLIDRKPRALTPQQARVLEDLAALVISELELRATRRAKEQEARELQHLFAELPLAVVVLVGDEMRFVNDNAHAMLGYAPGELAGRAVQTIIAPAERDAHTRALGALRALAASDLTPRLARRALLRKDGTVIEARGTIARMTYRGEAAVVVAMGDVTAEASDQRARDEQRKLLLQTFDVLPEGIVLFDPAFRCVYANRAIGELLDLPVKDIAGWNPDDATRRVAELARDPDAARVEMKRARELGVSATLDLVRPRARVLRRTLHEVASKEHPYVAVWTDITHEAAALAASESAALTDALTKLPNRRAIEPKIKAASANGGKAAVVLFDIDHFKKVNDTYGHGVGDRVLCAVGQAIAGVARSGDMVARFGGEEFIALLRADLEGARSFGERARAAVAELTTAAGKVTISGGIALTRAGGDVVHEADERLYEAKRSGRNRVIG
jgi:diguanylate cyclase (GGDEF)-like protein/PAS domain S-box-containing protein